MSGDLWAYRVNLWVSVLHVALITMCFVVGTFPLVSLICLGVNAPLALHFKRKVNALPPAKAAKALNTPAKTAFDCRVYETRQFEDELVAAGIMKVSEMTTCDDKSCPYCCYTHRENEELRRQKHRNAVAKSIQTEKTVRAREKFEELRELDSRYKGYRFKDYEFQQRLRQSRDKEELEPPPGVPDFAVPSLDYDHMRMCDRIVWKWVDNDGCTCVRTQLVPNQIAVEIVEGTGKVLRRYL